jgi:hypothetical protein
METTNERIIKDIEKLIQFYEKLGESNPQIEAYLTELHKELELLTNPSVEDVEN